MRKLNKKKPSHSMLSNFLWSVKMLLQNSRLGFFLILLLIPINIAVQYLDIYLPALVVTEVTSGQNLSHAVISVGIVMLLILLCHTALEALDHIKASALMLYRGKTGRLIIQKQLSMFYQAYERKDVRDLCGRANQAAEMWNGVQPLTDIVTNGFGILENLLGYILFGSVIFHEGAIVQTGTHAERVANENGKYYELWNAQAQYYTEQ